MAVQHDNSLIPDSYTCPMHPQIRENKPGQCPICGMDLVKKETTAPVVKEVQLNTLLQPANNFVLSAIPVTTIEQTYQQPEIKVLGESQYDTRLVGNISAKVSGRVDKLRLRYNYQDVKKGQKIMEIYSPELLTAEQNLLFISRNDASNLSLLSAAKQRLYLLGVSPQQLAQVIKSGKPTYAIDVFSNYTGHVHDIEAGMLPNTTPNSTLPATDYTTRELTLKEGMYVQKGQSLFLVYNPSRLWGVLNLFQGQEALVKVGDPVILTSEGTSQNIYGKINYIEPFYRKDSKSLTARVYFDNTRLHIPVGSQLKAIIKTRGLQGNFLPEQSVISLGVNEVVFIKSGGGFTSHKVMTGISMNGKIQIISGLSSADSVAIDAQYLVDSESFIRINKE